MAGYKLSEAAKADLIRIYHYGFEKFGESRADKYYNDLFDCFDDIAREPLMYPSDDALRAGYRRCVCGVDTIFYRISGHSVEIVRILGRQNKMGKL